MPAAFKRPCGLKPEKARTGHEYGKHVWTWSCACGHRAKTVGDWDAAQSAFYQHKRSRRAGL
jgi:hypothetical protein